MSLWRQLACGLRVMTHRKAADQEIADEVESYVEQAAAELVASGMSPAEARRRAQAQLGSTTVVREEVRSYGWENVVSTAISDLRYAIRRLRGNPGFTAISVLTLALGIGASTAIFGVIDGVLLKPLPYPQSERLVGLRHTAPGILIDDLNLAASLYFTYREENRVFENVGMWQGDTVSVTGVGEPEELPVLLVTNEFLSVLGVQPALGRPFGPADDDPKSVETVILSDGYWKSRFGADRTVLGRRILMDGEAREVIGVMPPSFKFMDRPVSVLLPFRMNRADIRLISFCCEGAARLKPGVTLKQANADVARMLALAPSKFPLNPGSSADTYEAARIAPRLRVLKDLLVGNIGETLWVLMGTVGIVLLIACANVANLLLVRADGRRQELAIRLALGAGWGRIARELLIEALVLGVCGGSLGLALAYSALRVVAASEVPYLPRIKDVAIDANVVMFTLSVSFLSALVFGLIPVLKYARPGLSTALRGGGRTLSQSKERRQARNVLVVVQVSLAMILLVGSGLMIRTFQALRHVDPGFSGASEVETLSISIPEVQFKQPERAIRMEEEILSSVGAIPEVQAAAVVNVLPMQGGSNDPVHVEHESAAVTVPPIRRYKIHLTRLLRSDRRSTDCGQGVDLGGDIPEDAGGLNLGEHGA